MKEAAKVLYPQKRSLLTGKSSRSRFSTLLLEHGEKAIQDWAVLAYSNPTNASHKGPTSSWGEALPTATTTANSSRKASKSSKRRHKMQGEVSKESHPTVYMTKWEGRLFLCSKSLVFEPNDWSRPVIRVPFVKMPRPPQEYPADVQPSTTGQFEPMCVDFSSLTHWLMRPNGSIGPYHNLHVATTFRLTFLHSSPSTLVDLSNQLFDMLQNKNSQALEDLLQPMYERPFDFASLKDVRETPLLQSPSSPGYLRCTWMHPLQSTPGCLVVTQQRVYFQPAAGVLGAEYATSQSQSWHLPSQLVATARRYRGLEDSALELYWKDGPSTLFSFERKHSREQVLRALPDVPCHTDRDFLIQASRAWQTKTISNYDYLLLLNSAAGRSFQDLSRYPVVPWVLQDYESTKLDLSNPDTFRDLTKPIGALNQKRLEYFQHRYENMLDAVENPFLYGTHYSAAGYVLYYLVRSMPEHMLCLQNGKFDSPDRMFHSLSHTFATLLTNHADVKELIPEFYSPNLDFDFLINARGLQLGATQSGDRVNDVSLPPWAKSPRDFLRKNSKALESDIVTNMLPRWIDLIFGSKSRGEAAKEASNLFHQYAYMGPQDLADLPTQEERFQAEMHATEFGLVPDQLFVGPHPLRHQTVDDSFVNPDIGRSFGGGDDFGKSADAWELLESPVVVAGVQSDRALDGNTESDEFGDGLLASVPSVDSAEGWDRPTGDFSGRPANPTDPSGRKSNKGIPLSGTGDIAATGSGAFSQFGKEPTLSNVSSSSALASPRSFDALQPSMTPSATSTEWDIRFLEKNQIHLDAISGCSVLSQGGPENAPLLVSTSLDGGLKMHALNVLGTDHDDATDKRPYQGITSTFSRFSYLTKSRGPAASSDQSKLTEFRSHSARDPLACLAMASDGHGGKVAFAGGHDDVVLAYGVNSACAVASVYSHRDAVTGLSLLVRPGATASNSLWLESATHIMVSGSWDATVKVWSVTVAQGETVSINREPLAELFDADSSIVCVSAATVPDTGGIVIGAGCADGSFYVWNLHSDGMKVLIHKEPARRGSGPCSAVQWSTGPGVNLHLFTGFATGKVATYSLVDGTMKRASAASVGVPVQCLVYSEGILLIGCADGGLRLIPIRDGATFTSDLSLWPAVNGKSAPGLTSVTISYLGNVADGSGKCVCCTGGEDGSVALFELKRVAPR
eukprot:Nitzschia sp. Nitz4//scaffold56_size114212//51688//55330//NITZ4_003948-RA/size114212-snap-gene-0.172-mRNA-1//1//CDS//3329554700//1198//frame0